MRVGWAQATLAVGLLALIHVSLGLLPGPTLSPSTNFALFATNLYVLYCAAAVRVERSAQSVGLFLAGYLVLFLLLMVILDKKPLFILLVIVYASVFRSAFLLGLFVVFFASFVVLQPYALETFVPLTAIYLVLWRLKGTSLFLKACLALGLSALALLLFPLFHVAIQDSLQTLLVTLKRPDVQAAVWMSVSSSTVATICIALWGVPLAYALARVEFTGKRLVESLIDVPILVPQSVAGIALMVLLGPGSPLGSAIDEMLGIEISGRFIGIVLAQIFVAAPFLVKTAMTSFEGVPEHLEMASRTLGASASRTFWRITLPLASRGIAVGMILAWSRAVSEFGAIILFASSPVTAPVLVHTEFVRAGASESRPVAILLLIICLWIFILLQFGQTFLPAGLKRRSWGGRP